MAGTPYPLPRLPPPLPPVTDPNIQPPRPPNSWILYRAWKLKQLPPPGPGEGRRNQSDVSTMLSTLWRNESTEIREYFERLADEAKAEHKLRYPNYRYQPKKKEDGKAPRPPKAKKAPKAIRGTSGELEAGTSLAEQRVGHPYASSSRPSRETAVRVPPSPPMSAASSPSIEPSTPPTSVFECPELELQQPSSNVVTDVSPSHAPLDSTLLQTPVPDSFDYASNSSPDIPDSQNSVDTPGWNFSEPQIPFHLMDSLYQGDPWTPDQYCDANINNQQTVCVYFSSDIFTRLSHFSSYKALPFDIPAGLNNLGTGDILPCGHPEVGPHQAQCFLPQASRTLDLDDLQLESQREFDIALGDVFGVVNPFGDTHGNLFSTPNSAYDIPLYPQDASSLPFNLEQEYPSDTNNNQEMNNFFFPPADPAAVYYFDNAFAEVAEVTEPFVQAAVDTPSYIPPSGAAHSSTRRVGGNWSGYARDMDMDLRPASQFEVQAS